MNHLAHLALSGNDHSVIIGNYIGDYVKGNTWQSHPEPVQRGILLHRSIDYYADTHEDYKKIIKVMRPFAGRFAGPIADIVSDALLSFTWHNYYEVTLPDFAQGIYPVLSNHLHLFPERLRISTPKMIAHNWLCQYGHQEGLAYVLKRFQERLPVTLDLEGILYLVFEDNQEVLEAFGRFYPGVLYHIGT